MKKNKSRPMSVRLLKRGYNHENSLKDVSNINNLINENNFKFYHVNEKHNVPWWVSYFNIDKINSVMQSGLLFITIAVNDDSRCLVFTFGHGHSQINDDAIEERFGLKVTLNSIDEKIKSIEYTEPSKSSRQTKIVSSAFEQLFFFNFDADSNFIQKVFARVKEEYQNEFLSATGYDSLKIQTRKQKDELLALSSFLYARYISDDYKQNEVLKDFDKMDKATKQEIKMLNKNLMTKILNKQYVNVVIADYEITAEDSFDHYKINDNDYLDLDNSIFEDLNLLTLDDLKNLKVEVFASPDDQDPKRWNFFKCLSTDVQENGNTFFLAKGVWFKINNDYVEEVDAILLKCTIDNPLFVYDVKKYGEFNNKTKKLNKSEFKYNKAHNMNDYKCLDRDCISIKSNKIEICDIYDKKQEILYHIKISTKSALLSHLWNQGLVSEEIARDFKEQYDNFFTERDLTSPSKRKVYYGIITKGKVIPLFSKITFLYTYKVFKRYNMEEAVKLFYIDMTNDE